jgi:hypothetical protein
MVNMGCDIIDSWAMGMDHFGKLRDINVSIIPGNYLDWPIAFGLALFTFGNEMVSSANRVDREV